MTNANKGQQRSYDEVQQNLDWFVWMILRNPFKETFSISFLPFDCEMRGRGIVPTMVFV